MGKSSRFAAASSGTKRGSWTLEEDNKLLSFVQLHGHGSWLSLPQKAGLQRCGKSCRLRWRNYLSPDIKRGNFSLHEDRTIIQLHALIGNRWSAIATHLPRRTDNEIKNYWNSHLKKRLAKIGFDPVTHKPTTSILASADGDPKNLANLSHIAQWESARLQAEARFVKESKLLRQREITALPPPQPVLLSQETPSFDSHQFVAPTLVPQCLDSLMTSSGAAPTDIINGQDHVDDGINVSGACDVNFEAPAYDQYLPGMVAYDGINTFGSSAQLDFGQCSELLAAFHHHNKGLQVGDNIAWSSLEQFM